MAGGKLPKVVPSTRCKLRQMKLERVMDFLLMEREFITNQEVLRPKEASQEKDTTKLDELRDLPMQVGCLEELVDDNHAIISTPHGPDLYVSILSVVDPDLLAPNAAVLLHHKYHSIVGVLADDDDPLVSVMKVEKAPLESYADIGGLDKQVMEIKEAVELPLTRPELYEDIGIKPPKGVVLYGEPGTGKTLLAKAVANSTSATFLRVTGSEMVQKYLGEGPKLVREIFKVADEHAPSIVFIDEIDAIGTKRIDASSSGEREVQRTMLELLNQLDGFDERGDVKVIMATNRIESLDPALIRPGRIDRKIEFPLPDVKTKRMIFRIHTSRMGLGEDVDLEGAFPGLLRLHFPLATPPSMLTCHSHAPSPSSLFPTPPPNTQTHAEFIMAKDDLSGADIKAVCTEAGMLALRERRMKVTQEDFRKAKEKALYRKKENVPAGLYI